jgi:hypothetical protein
MQIALERRKVVHYEVSTFIHIHALFQGSIKTSQTNLAACVLTIHQSTSLPTAEARLPYANALPLLYHYR